jgi:alkylhydroperoxidase family enzyme
MPPFDYAGLPFPVPDAMREAHRRAWQRLAAPGAWWTGSEKVAIAAEVRAARTCALCREREAALSPHAVVGEHAPTGVLPAAAVEAAHRIATDPGRLTRAWYEKTLAAGLSDAHYVELLAVVATIVNLDALHRGLGVPAEPLPEPVPGVPSRVRPPAVQGAPWVSWIALDSREARELYGGRPRVPNVARALSLIPDAVRQLQELSEAHYLPFDDVMDPRARMPHLARAQMELVAGRVSALNQCFY